MGFWEWMKEGLKEEAERQRVKTEEAKQEKQEFKDRVKQMKKESVAHCPKCKSTSIQYVERRKRLSIGRAITGSVVAGPVGGAVGGMTSKKHKGFIKCLNCGHKWKR